MHKFTDEHGQETSGKVFMDEQGAPMELDCCETNREHCLYSAPFFYASFYRITFGWGI